MYLCNRCENIYKKTNHSAKKIIVLYFNGPSNIYCKISISICSRLNYFEINQSVLKKIE